MSNSAAIIDRFSAARDTTDGELRGMVPSESGDWVHSGRQWAYEWGPAIAAAFSGLMMLSLTARPPTSTEAIPSFGSVLERKLRAAEAKLHGGHRLREAAAQLWSDSGPATGDLDALVRLSDVFHLAPVELPEQALLRAVRELFAKFERRDRSFRRLEWLATTTSEGLIPAVLAKQLEEGRVDDAYAFAAMAAAKQPTSATAKRWLRVLTPPAPRGEAQPVTEEAAASVRNNAAWLAEHAERYEGSWVALLDGELLGHARKLRELRKEVDIPPNALVARLVT